MANAQTYPREYKYTEAIIGYLAEKGRANTQEIAAHCGGTPNTIANALARLRAKKMVQIVVPRSRFHVNGVSQPTVWGLDESKEEIEITIYRDPLVVALFGHGPAKSYWPEPEE